jgi:N-methylhydantoinase A
MSCVGPRSCTIGVDVGGSLTDVVVSDDHSTWRAKAPTAPDDFSTGVMAACRLAAGQMSLDLPDLLPRVQRFGLGTTAVTNALTVRRGARVGLLTTKGFEHAPLMARGRRSAKDGWLEMPWSPLQLRQIGGVDERIGRGGLIVRPLSEADVALHVRRLVEDEGIEALAISFLWSFRNPAHEERAAELARAAYTHLPVFSGSSLQPAPREYERTMLAVMNAFCSTASARSMRNCAPAA